jgi:hypothetical protein
MTRRALLLVLMAPALVGVLSVPSLRIENEMTAPRVGADVWEYVVPTGRQFYSVNGIDVDRSTFDVFARRAWPGWK